MIVRSLKAIAESERDVSGPGWKSRRLLLASDGMGYSLNDTIILERASLTLEYKHHPFTVYALDKNDRHTVRATKGDMRLVCVFNPPLTGQEVHREDGSYAPAEGNH